MNEKRMTKQICIIGMCVSLLIIPFSYAASETPGTNYESIGKPNAESATGNREIITFIEGPYWYHKGEGLIVHRDIEIFGRGGCSFYIKGYMIPTKENGYRLTFLGGDIKYLKAHRFIGFFNEPSWPGADFSVKGIAFGDIEWNT
jgi:hypothetical protein